MVFILYIHRHKPFTPFHHYSHEISFLCLLSFFSLKKVWSKSENTFSALLNNRPRGGRDACPCHSLSLSLHPMFEHSSKSILPWQRAACTPSLLFCTGFHPCQLPVDYYRQIVCSAKDSESTAVPALMSYLAHWRGKRTYPRQSRSVTLTNWALAVKRSICP